MNYSGLLHRILQNETLNEAIENISKRTLAFNLVNENWLKLLKESPVHQAHKERTVKYSRGKKVKADNAFIRNVISPKHYYDILIAGLFYASEVEFLNEELVKKKNITFVPHLCDPLVEIGKAMQETPMQNLHDGARLFIDTCNPILCRTCRQSHQKHKVQLTENNWCVLKTLVFDGETILNAFKTQLASSMIRGGSFGAILHVHICSRTTFNSEYKIGGKIKEMIIFQEQALYPVKNLNFGMILPFDNQPRIEYPDDNEPLVSIINETDDDESKTKRIKFDDGNYELKNI